MCIRGLDLAPFYDLLLSFGTVPTVWYCLFFLLIGVFTSRVNLQLNLSDNILKLPVMLKLLVIWNIWNIAKLKY